MSDKQELTDQEKQLLDFIAAMYVQIVIKEADRKKEGFSAPEMPASE